MTEIASPKKLPRFAFPLLIVLAVALVFGQVWRFDFVSWDDDQLIYANPLYNPPDAGRIAATWKAPYLELYIPLTYAAWGALARLGYSSEARTAPAGAQTHLTTTPFHGANFVLHLLSALLVWAVLRRALPESRARDGAAAAGALLFALHPLQVESVAWASEFKGLLSAFFALLALHQFLVALQSETKAPLRAGAAWLFYLLALLSKPAALPLPLMALALGSFSTNLPIKTVARRLGAWWILMVAWLFVTRWAQPSQSINIPLWWRSFIAGDALTFYAAKLVLPLNLSAHYGRTPPRVMEAGFAYFMVLPPLLVMFALWKIKRPIVTTAVLLFLLPLLPVLGFVPFKFQGYSTVADRYAYLALLGPALILAWWLSHRPARAVWAGTGVVLLVLSILTFRQSATWADSHSLFEHTLKVNPQSWMALNNMGLLLDGEGNPELARDFYEKALAAQPNNKESLNNIGILQARSGDLAGAEKSLERALTIDPNYDTAWANLGNVRLEKNRLHEAEAAYQKAAQLLPYSSEVRANWGMALARQEKYAEAIAQYREALRLAPRDVSALYNLGLAQFRGGDPNGALQTLQQAVQTQPDFWDARHAVAVVLLSQKKRREAVAQWQELLQLNPQYSAAQRALASLQKQTRK